LEIYRKLFDERGAQPNTQEAPGNVKLRVRSLVWARASIAPL